MLIEDVHEAIFDLVELIKTYKSKNKLSKVLMSTLFKRRQDELDAVVDRAIVRLQVTCVHTRFRNKSRQFMKRSGHLIGKLVVKTD